MVGDTQLVMPNIVDAYNQGAAQGRADRTRRTLSQYLQPALGGDQGALAQIYSADPQAGVQTQNEAFHQQQQAYTQQQQAQQSDQQTKQFADADLQRLGQHARLIANAAQSGNMALANSIYQSVYPEASKILGSNLPQTLTPDQLPNIQKLADTVAPLPKPAYTFQKDVPTGGYDSHGNPITQDGFVAQGQPFQPLQGPAAAIAATPTSNLNTVPQGTLAQAVMAQESGGNPNAISPKGARGRMQIMPSTAANPGYGIQPSNGTPQDDERVASQYLDKMTQLYGTSGGLAAYNGGPGRLGRALLTSGGDTSAAIGQMPDETQAYVPGVLNRLGGSGDGGSQPAAPTSLSFGQSVKAPKQTQANAPSGYRFKADGSGSLEAIPGGPNDAQAQLESSGMTPDAITDAAWDKILNGKDIQGMGKAAVQQRAAVRNQVAKIASDAGVSPQELVTTAGRNKALQASLTNLQKQGDMMNKNEETFQNNAQVLRDIATQLNQGGGTAWNNFMLNLKSNATSDPLVARYKAAQATVAQEYSKIAQGSTGASGTTEGAREHAYEVLNKGYSVDALNGALDTLQQDINGQKKATQDQLNVVRGHMSDFGQQQQPSKKSDSGWSIQLVNQ